MNGARTSMTGWLARMGFADTSRAERQLADLGITGDEPVLSALAQAPDPELALTGLSRVAERCGDAGMLREALNTDRRFRERLAAVLGVSKELAEHLARHPDDCAVLRGPAADRRPGARLIRAELLSAVGADPEAAAPVAGHAGRNSQAGHGPRGGTAGPGGAAAGDTDPAVPLAAAYRRRVLHLAARDLTGKATVEEVAEELADLADAVLEAALAIARAGLPADAAPCRLAVIAMGKCGARELNYASDVDVIFVAGAPENDNSKKREPADPAAADPGDEQAALKTATRLAAGLIQACERVTPEGSLFPVDPNLRPEGRNGPLVRTLNSHLAYYDRWAKTWEFQALLKARLAAGDRTLGEEYCAAVAPLVWQASGRKNFVEDVQAMRVRVEDNIPKSRAVRELKLGPGGLRDIEFSVQLLQLVHGRTDESLRAPATLAALRALAAGGYVGRADAADLAESYRFLRQSEHLLQLYQLRRTHTLPEDSQVRRRLGRAMRLTSPNGSPGAWEAGRPAGTGRGSTVSPEEAFTGIWRRHALRVRRLHEKLFYRPLLDAVAKLPGDAVRLTPEAARARLEALGYEDPAGALRHIEALTSGLRRRAAIQRTLLPVLLGWFADAAEPDAGLLAFRQVSEALGETPWYLRLLRDETEAAHRIATVLASSRYATGLLLRAPEAVAIFGDDSQLVPKTAGSIRSEMMAAATRHEADAEGAAVAVRSLRRRELLRVAAADVLGAVTLAETADGLTAITEASLDAVLAAAIAKVEQDLRRPVPTRFAVIAMGRFGGYESGYGSDADVIFVHDPLPGGDAAAERAASDAAQAVGTELRRLLELPAPDPPLVVDTDLRPEGRQGPLVRSLAACRAYYARRASPWEFQALLRARFAAGDATLGAEFLALADGYRYPDGGLTEAAVREIRRIKARVEGERIPRGANRALHVKLGPGGLADVEWTVQLLQLTHGGAVPALRTTRTLEALDAAVEAGLAEEADAAALRESWQLASRIRNAVMLVSGRSSDSLPSRHKELTAVARLLGYAEPGADGADEDGIPDGGLPRGDPPGQALEEDYRRTARRARTVMERLFYG